MKDYKHNIRPESIEIAITAINKYRQSVGSNGEKLTEHQKFDETTSHALQDLRRLLTYLNKQ